MVPRINVHDGKHRMIIAEEGERVLTKDQNREYESQHPEARQAPMKAEVYDLGGALDYLKENAGKHQNPGLSKAGLRDAAAPVDLGPQMDQIPLADCGGRIYDKGGTLPAQDNSMWGSIKNRAGEIYEKAKQAGSNLMKYPTDTANPTINEIHAKQKQYDDLKKQGELQAGTLPESVQAPYEATPSDRVNPMAKYGSRPGEQRLNFERPTGMDQNRQELQNTAPLPQKMQLFDDSGVVQHEDPDKAAKDAALQQAIQEAKEAPISHGGAQEREEATAQSEGRLPAPKNPVRMQYDTEKPVDEAKGVADNMSGGAQMSTQNAPLSKPTMNTQNTVGLGLEPTSAKAGTIPAPRPSKMNYTPEPAAAAPEAPPAAPDPMDIIKQDKLAAMKKGTAGLADLGTSLIHERTLMPTYTGPNAKKMTQGEQIPEEQLGKDEKKYGQEQAHAEFKNKLKDYDTRIQTAMDLGTPEGAQEAASLQLAKSHFERMNPYGSAANHPGLIGKIEHGLATAGEIAGSMTVPEVVQQLPGTEMHRQMLDTRARAQQGEATKEGLEQAQTKQASIGSKLPPPTQVFDDLKGQTNPETGKIYTDQERLEVAQNPGKASEVTYARKFMKDNPGSTYEQGAADYHRMVAGTKPTDEVKQPVGTEGAARHDAELSTLTGGMSTSDKEAFLRAYAVKPTDTLAVQTKRLEDAKASAQLSSSELDRKMAREQAQRNHEEVMANSASNKSKSEGIKARQEVAKIYADPMLSSERYNIMTKNLSDAVQHHDQQAMLSLLANHLGMTMGLQKGARLNQAIINEAASSQPWLAKINAKFDKDGYLSGLTLGPEQMKSMVNLARERYHEDVVKARNTAKYAGAEDDGPDRTPSTSTMHYYLDLSGGDVNKAKQLADEDGWTVQKPKGK